MSEVPLHCRQYTQPVVGSLRLEDVLHQLPWNQGPMVGLEEGCFLMSEVPLYCRQYTRPVVRSPGLEDLLHQSGRVLQTPRTTCCTGAPQNYDSPRGVGIFLWAR